MADKEIVRRPVASALLEQFPASMPSVLRRIYAARGAAAAELDHSLRALLPVSELEGTDAAAERLARARHARERVIVVGDFDADGATATALVVHCLRAFGFRDPGYVVPDRFRFGYGLSAGIVAEADRLAPDVLVTVDNGISSNAGVEEARTRGVDVVITDHHLPGSELPDAAAIVNPNLPGNGFASKALAGVGVAFYVMAALGQRLAADGVLEASEARRVCADCLDLVALGTVADLVPLDYNNRILVAQGLRRIRAGASRPGIEALFAAAGRSTADAAPSDLGFGIAPRLNAAGRLADMSLGIECLLSRDPAGARQAATRLSELNAERRSLQARMQEEAEVHVETERLADDGRKPDAVCLYDDGWHQGVVGLVASRIKDQLNRPVIAFADGEGEGMLKGSCRSVQGVHMRDLLAGIDARQPGLIERFGGHSMAAGLSLRADQLETFRAAFLEAAAAQRDRIAASDRVETDGPLAADELELGLAEQLRHAGPWGQAFPEPVFDGRFEVVSQRIVGKHHLKLGLRPVSGGRPIDGIAFNVPDTIDTRRHPEIHLAYRLDVNEYAGRRNPQLVIEHIRLVADGD